MVVRWVGFHKRSTPFFVGKTRFWSTIDHFFKRILKKEFSPDLFPKFGCPEEATEKSWFGRPFLSTPGTPFWGVGHENRRWATIDHFLKRIFKRNFLQIFFRNLGGPEKATAKFMIWEVFPELPRDSILRSWSRKSVLGNDRSLF